MTHQVVVIIGTGGMGLPIARRLGSGRRLLLADYSDDNLEAALTTLRSEGHNAESHAMTVTDNSAVRELALVARNAGQIDAIIHTAGVAPGMVSAKQIFEINLLGTANVIEAFLPVVSPGTSLVCIASMAGSMTRLSLDMERHFATAPLDQLLQPEDINLETLHPGMAYGMAHRGNQLRIQAAARAWGSKGARLNSVSPGVISTASAQKLLRGSEGNHMQSLIDLSAARRLGTPDDVANVVAFLTSPGSNFIHGTDILLDGGAVAGQRWHVG